MPGLLTKAVVSMFFLADFLLVVISVDFEVCPSVIIDDIFSELEDGNKIVEMVSP